MATLELSIARWVPNLHPRWPKGTFQGGQFMKSGHIRELVQRGSPHDLSFLTRGAHTIGGARLLTNPPRVEVDGKPGFPSHTYTLNMGSKDLMGQVRQALSITEDRNAGRLGGVVTPEMAREGPQMAAPKGFGHSVLKLSKMNDRQVLSDGGTHVRYRKSGVGKGRYEVLDANSNVVSKHDHSQYTTNLAQHATRYQAAQEAHKSASKKLKQQQSLSGGTPISTGVGKAEARVEAIKRLLSQAEKRGDLSAVRTLRDDLARARKDADRTAKRRAQAKRRAAAASTVVKKGRKNIPAERRYVVRPHGQTGNRYRVVDIQKNKTLQVHPSRAEAEAHRNQLAGIKPPPTRPSTRGFTVGVRPVSVVTTAPGRYTSARARRDAEAEIRGVVSTADANGVDRNKALEEHRKELGRRMSSAQQGSADRRVVAIRRRQLRDALAQHTHVSDILEGKRGVPGERVARERRPQGHTQPPPEGLTRADRIKANKEAAASDVIHTSIHAKASPATQRAFEPHPEKPDHYRKIRPTPLEPRPKADLKGGTPLLESLNRRDIKNMGKYFAGTPRRALAGYPDMYRAARGVAERRRQAKKLAAAGGTAMQIRERSVSGIEGLTLPRGHTAAVKNGEIRVHGPDRKIVARGRTAESVRQQLDRTRPSALMTGARVRVFEPGRVLTQEGPASRVEAPGIRVLHEYNGKVIKHPEAYSRLTGGRDVRVTSKKPESGRPGKMTDASGMKHVYIDGVHVGTVSTRNMGRFGSWKKANIDGETGSGTIHGSVIEALAQRTPEEWQRLVGTSADTPHAAKRGGRTLADFKVGDRVNLGGVPIERVQKQGWGVAHGVHVITKIERHKDGSATVHVRHEASGHEYDRLGINSASLASGAASGQPSHEADVRPPIPAAPSVAPTRSQRIMANKHASTHDEIPESIHSMTSPATAAKFEPHPEKPGFMRRKQSTKASPVPLLSPARSGEKQVPIKRIPVGSRVVGFGGKLRKVGSPIKNDDGSIVGRYWDGSQWDYVQPETRFDVYDVPHGKGTHKLFEEHEARMRSGAGSGDGQVAQPPHTDTMAKVIHEGHVVSNLGGQGTPASKVFHGIVKRDDGTEGHHFSIDLEHPDFKTSTFQLRKGTDGVWRPAWTSTYGETHGWNPGRGLTNSEQTKMDEHLHGAMGDEIDGLNKRAAFAQKMADKGGGSAASYRREAEALRRRAERMAEQRKTLKGGK